jgi:uncharacterized protein (DUF305 family)
MHLPNLRNGFVTLTFVAIASFSSGVLTPCSKTASQAQTNTTINTSDNKQMNHESGMDHSMMMDLGPADASYDLRFIDAMTPHHQGGVDMAKAALEKSQHPELKKLARQIIAAQNKEIAQMKQWRQAWYPQAGDKPLAYDAHKGHTMEMSPEQEKNMMMSMNLSQTDAPFDLNFINAMIPHHQGAVTMAQDALSKSQRPQIKKLAQNIITSQQAEIQQMKQWRKDWYNK